MPNVTITVPEELKTQMDELSEVSWSEICRSAISQYISQRKNPTPRIDLDARTSRLNSDGWNTGYPTLTVEIRIQNRMNSEITVDRVLTTANSRGEDGQTVHLGQANDLHRIKIASNSAGVARINLLFSEEKLRKLQRKFTSTFDCNVECTVFLDDFKNEYRQPVSTQIPIDTWNNFIKRALRTNQAT